MNLSKLVSNMVTDSHKCFNLLMLYIDTAVLSRGVDTSPVKVYPATDAVCRLP